MKILNSAEFITMEIDADGTRRFEAFLDRNFPSWRKCEMFKAKNAGTIQRKWQVGIDDLERIALYRRDYVEIYDACFDDEEIHYPKNLICDIDGDATSVAVWAK